MEDMKIYLVWLFAGFLGIWNICLHSVGINLLLHLRRNGIESVDQLYLISLSFAEIGYNVIFVLFLPLQLYILHNKIDIIAKIYWYKVCGYVYLYYLR